MQPFAVLVAVGSVAAGEAAPPADAQFQAPRLAVDPAAEIERCRQSWSKHGRITGETEVTVWLDANGRVTGIQTSADAEPLAAQAAQCAALGLRYVPATRAGSPVAGSLRVPVGFRTPPMIHRSPNLQQWYRCYPKSKRYEGIEGRVVMSLAISAQGRIESHTVPEDTEAWLVDAANCIARYYEFLPGLDRGVPVQANATLPVYFKNNEISLEAFARSAAPTVTGLRRKEPVDEDPVPASNEEEIIAAYRQCYPADYDASANITYEISVEISGAVRKVDVVESSGDARLDTAGACILTKLRFKPATFNGYAVADTVHWPLLVRPPP